VIASVLVEESSDRAVLHLVGEFDIGTRLMLRSDCRRLARLAPDVHVDVDLSEVDFIDCASLREVGALVSARCGVGDAPAVRVTTPFLQRLLDVSGMVSAQHVELTAPT
jgi:anti-anti-sigma factor